MGNSTANLKVSGSIITELSEKIPSNIFALNELIKNAYDAFSSFVSIDINLDESCITISDDGEGMSDANIKELFHIATSTKRYGEVRKKNGLERYTQGSKGLGFLSVFKFGREVEWTTYKNNQEYTFGVSREEVINSDNVTDMEVDIRVANKSGQGTIIKIQSDKRELAPLVDYFKIEKNALKLVGAFDDESFKIELSLPGNKKFKSEKIPAPQKINPNDQLFTVKYKSVNEQVCFYHLGKLIKTEDLKLNSSRYSLSAEVIIYNLNSYGKRKISPYFYREPDEALTPLLFINKNLFNSYSLFDSGLYRQTQSGQSLPQMIGTVSLLCQDEELAFNSDRTNFVENSLTELIKKDLVRLNSVIQKTGSALKKNLKKGKGRLTGPSSPDSSDSEPEKEKVSPAYINLDSDFKKLVIPSLQIDLRTYIKEARCSSGENIPTDDVQIEVDDISLDRGILPAVEAPCAKRVTYKYNDRKTNLVVSEMTLKFEEKESYLLGEDQELELFVLPSSTNYKIRLPLVSTIIKQISDAHKLGDKYNALIASALRTVFEISLKELNEKHRYIFSHPKPTGNIGKLEWKTTQLVAFILSNKKLSTEICKKIDFDFSNLKNILKIKDFSDAIGSANLGSHHSLTYLTADKVRATAKHAGYTAILCDALVQYFSEEDILKYGLAEPSELS